MSGWLTGWGPKAQPVPGPVPPPSQPSSERGLSTNPFFNDTKGPYYTQHYDPYKEEEDEKDYEKEEEYYKRYILNEMTAKQQIIIGEYQIMDLAPLLKKDGTNMGSIPITFTSGFSFNLKTPETIKHFFIKIDGTYYAFEFRYGKLKSQQMDLDDNESKAFDEVSYGAFTESAVQSKVDAQEPIKHLVVNVYKTDKYGRVISEHTYKELQLQKGVIEDARKKHPSMSGIDVNISKGLIDTLLDKNPNWSVEQVPELYGEKVVRRTENTRNALEIYTDATKSGLDLLAKLRAYHDFYDALFVTTNPNPATDSKKFKNMSDIELKNYIEKLYHIIVIIQLDDTKKNEIKEYLRILYKSPDRTKILGLKLELTRLLGDTELIDLMGIKNEVPIINGGDFEDKKWMLHYHAGMAAAELEIKRKGYLEFGTKIGVELNFIERLIRSTKVASEEKLKSINKSLQKIKGIFLPKLMVLLNNIQSLVENHPLTRQYVIVDLDNITTLEQALDRLTQLLASSKLSKNQELTQLTHDIDFDGGSRFKQKKKTRKRTKKRNKSKRHKGYSRR